MKIECIAIGDELLDGRIVEGNGAWLGGFLVDRGVELARTTIVSDELHDILGVLEEARAPIVVVCGGLGPTADDLTRDAVARWLQVDQQEDREARDRMERRFAARGLTPSANNYQQTMFPHGATVLQTEVGSAAGFRIDRATSTYFFFPGVPREFQWFVQTYLPAELPSRDVSRWRGYFLGRGESALETDLDGIQALSATHDVRVGYRAAYPLIEVKLGGPAPGVDTLRRFVLDRVGTYLVGEDEESQAARVGRRLVERGMTLATAESCTGGGIASAITDVAGSSAWFERAWVTYANRAKHEELGVVEEVLAAFGAVSPQTVVQMAVGARRRAGANIAVAVSGIAGPTGGTADKPVGTVEFGLATPEGVYHRRVHFTAQGRDLVRQATVCTALAMIQAWLDGDPQRLKLRGPFADDVVMRPEGIPSEWVG